MKRISDRTWLLLILLAGLSLRGGLLWRQYGRLAEDADGYRAIAKFVAGGEGYLHPRTDSPTAYRPPAYTMLLAAIFSLGLGQAGIAVVHLLLGTSTIFLTWSLGCRLGMSRYSLLAAAIIAVDPILLQHTTLVMTETLATFLIALLLRVSIPDFRNSRCETPTRGRLFAVGVIFGVCVLCRPAVWAFGALVAVRWLFRRFRRKTAVHPWPVVIGLLLAVSPWVVRNTIVLGKPILTTTHGGYTLLLGNNPVYYDEVVSGRWGVVWSGESLRRWQDHLETEMKRNDPPVTTELDRDRWMYARARRNIADRPLLFFQSCLLRWGRGLWGVIPLSDGETVGPVLKWGAALFYVIVFAGMLWGMISLKNPRVETWMPMLLLLAAFTLVHSCYWANLRMRAPLMPAIALMFAQGSFTLESRRRGSLKTGSADGNPA